MNGVTITYAAITGWCQRSSLQPVLVMVSDAHCRPCRNARGCPPGGPCPACRAPSSSTVIGSKASRVRGVAWSVWADVSWTVVRQLNPAAVCFAGLARPAAFGAAPTPPICRFSNQTSHLPSASRPPPAIKSGVSRQARRRPFVTVRAPRAPRRRAGDRPARPAANLSARGRKGIDGNQQVCTRPPAGTPSYSPPSVATIAVSERDRCRYCRAAPGRAAGCWRPAASACWRLSQPRAFAVQGPGEAEGQRRDLFLVQRAPRVSRISAARAWAAAGSALMAISASVAQVGIGHQRAFQVLDHRPHLPASGTVLPQSIRCRRPARSTMTLPGCRSPCSPGTGRIGTTGEQELVGQVAPVGQRIGGPEMLHRTRDVDRALDVFHPITRAWRGRPGHPPHAAVTRLPREDGLHLGLRSNCSSLRKPSTKLSICSVMAFRKGVSLPCGAQYWLDTSISAIEVLPIRNSRSRLWRPILMITGTSCSTPRTSTGFWPGRPSRSSRT